MLRSSSGTRRVSLGEDEGERLPFPVVYLTRVNADVCHLQGNRNLPGGCFALQLPGNAETTESFLTYQKFKRLALRCSSCSFLVPSLAVPNKHFSLNWELIRLSRILGELCGTSRILSVGAIKAECISIRGDERGI